MKKPTMLEEIIVFCEKNNITPYQLAKNINLSELAIRNILNGKTTKPRINNIKLIHDFLFKGNTQTPTINENKIKSDYDLKIDSVKDQIKELEKSTEFLSEEISSVNEEAAEYFKIKIKSNLQKIDLLKERIEIIQFAKNNQKQE